MPTNRPITKILLDGGDPDETLRIRNLLGFLDGQTTNPTFVAKNPDVQRRIASGHKLSREEQKEKYKQIVQKISPLVGSAGVSIEVFADFDTTAEQMVAQGEEMFSWIPNAYIKYPCIREGLRAAKISVERNMRVNMTLCFSQAQAAAVYAATRGSKEPVYVSPFVGRLDDRGDCRSCGTSKKCTDKATAMFTCSPQVCAGWTTCSTPLTSALNSQPRPQRSSRSGQPRRSQLRERTSSIRR
jgi:transaldolase